MTDLTEQLTNKKIKNVGDYLGIISLDNLSHKKLPSYIYDKYGVTSLSKAVHRWNSLSIQLHELVSQNREIVLELKKTCIGSAISTIAVKLTYYADWLYETAKNAQLTEDCARRAQSFYLYLQPSLIKPEKFQEILNTIAELSKNNSYELHIERIAELQGEYAEGEASNIRDITRYYNSAVATMADLPRFSELSLTGNTTRPASG